jgi:uncharacterized protein YqgC (DUF456 family)
VYYYQNRGEVVDSIVASEWGRRQSGDSSGAAKKLMTGILYGKEVDFETLPPFVGKFAAEQLKRRELDAESFPDALNCLGSGPSHRLIGLPLE